VESAVNEIVAKRMNKAQQMRWNRATVQPFLDVRTAVLNGTLEDAFRRAIRASGPRTKVTRRQHKRRDHPPTILHALDLLLHGVALDLVGRRGVEGDAARFGVGDLLGCQLQHGMPRGSRGRPGEWDIGRVPPTPPAPS
jgi:hypothetical protein